MVRAGKGFQRNPVKRGEMTKARKKLVVQGQTEFEMEDIHGYEEKYLEAIASGREENKTTKHKYAKKDEQTLLNRLEKYMHNHLLFLHNFKVPFDDNMSERDLRKVKNCQWFLLCMTTYKT